MDSALKPHPQESSNKSSNCILLKLSSWLPHLPPLNLSFLQYPQFSKFNLSISVTQAKNLGIILDSSPSHTLYNWCRTWLLQESATFYRIHCCHCGASWCLLHMGGGNGPVLFSSFPPWPPLSQNHADVVTRHPIPDTR